MVDFEDSEQRLTEEEFRQAEAEIGHQLPDSFREHYLEYNGGTPIPAVFPGDGDWEEIEIATFFPIKYNSSENDLKRTLLEGKYHFMVERGVIPKGLLPFANDHGGNFFCLDLGTGEVCFYATDAFDSDLTPEENHKKARRTLSPSFEAFLASITESTL